MSEKQEINNGKGRTGYALAIIALVFGFLLAKKYYTFILLWGIVPLPVTLGDYYVLLLDEPELRMKSLILGIISIGVTLYFIRKIYKSKDGVKKLKLGIISLILSVLFSLSFYFVAPSYTFKTYPQLFMYMDSKGEYIEKPAYYLWLVDKLGFYQETYRPFQTLDDAIQGLEFAKEKEDKLMYEYIFDDLERFGYENVIKNYKNEIFQKELLSKFVSVDFMNGKYNWEKESVEKFLKNERFIGILKVNTSNRQIKEACLYIEERFSLYQQSKITQKVFFSKLYMEVENLLK